MTTTPDQPTAPVGTPAGAAAGLDARGLWKRYGGVPVLRGVDFRVKPGQVLCLVGENGAGKSTLCGILAGIVAPDQGTMSIDGSRYAPADPGQALRAGVALVHQEIRLVSELSVAENVFLGRLPMRGARVDRTRMEHETAAALQLLGTDIDPARPVGDLSVAGQQAVEIAKALTRAPRYIVFDEPSATLGETETERIFERISALRGGGVGIVYISHRLDEVKALADQIVVLRDGARVAHWDTGKVPTDKLVYAMVGRELVIDHSDPDPPQAETVLRVHGLARTGAFAGVEFELRAGEILGVAGLVGAGRTEMVRTLAGADLADAGEMLLDGRPLRPRSPRTAIDAGIAMVPEDRKSQGLLLNQSARQNMALPWERSLAKRGVITAHALASVSDEQGRSLDIRGSLDIPVAGLSGGNQQKVLIGKWLVRRPKVLILDEPTRGVDVGAKASIYRIIRRLAAEGVAVIMVSSELEEILGLSHRILVMARGRQQGIVPRAQASAESVMSLALGVSA